MEGPTDLDEQIDNMLGKVPPAKPVEPPVTEPPVTEPTEPPAEPPVVPPTEPPVAKPPVVEPPAVSPAEPPVVTPPVEPPTEPPVTEPVAETSEQVVSRLEEQNRLLLERVEHLSTPQEFRPTQEPVGSVVPAVTLPTAEPTTPTAVVPDAVIPTPTPAAPSTPAEQKLFDFLKDIDLENITENPTEFNTLLNEVVTQAGIRNVDVVVEKILTSIPNLVAGQIIQQNNMNKLVGDFYDVNQDLKPVKRTVGAFVNEVHAEHPDWKVQDVFKESATRTRKTLGLKEQALGRSEGDPPLAPADNPPASPPPNADPAFARQRGARRGTEPELTGMAGEIDDMLKIS